MSATRDRKRREQGLDQGPQEDISEEEKRAALDFSPSEVRIDGMSLDQIRKLREFYVNHTGDTTLKELGK